MPHRSSLRIRMTRMGMSDLKAVLRIEEASFPSPWSRQMFLSEVTGNPFAHAYVVRAEGTDRIIAYVCFWIVFDELHLLNLAVDLPYRGQGIGEEVLRRILVWGWTKGIRTATLEVRASNRAAQRLYDKVGFKHCGTRKSYYSEPQEDAWLFRLTEPGGLHGPRDGDRADSKDEP